MVAKDAFWREHWDKKKKRVKEATMAGRILIRTEKQRLQVATPFHEGFNERAKELGGRWRHRTGFWSFPLASRRLVLKLIREVYGEQAVKE